MIAEHAQRQAKLRHMLKIQHGKLCDLAARIRESQRARQDDGEELSAAPPSPLEAPARSCSGSRGGGQRQRCEPSQQFLVVVVGGGESSGHSIELLRRSPSEVNAIAQLCCQTCLLTDWASDFKVV